MNTEKPRMLKMGSNSPLFSKPDLEKRINEIKATVEHYCPDFVKAMWTAKKSKAAFVVPQQSFADGYHEDEYILLAMCVKYAGLYGMPVIFAP